MKNIWNIIITRPEVKYVLIGVGLIIMYLVLETVWEIYKTKRFKEHTLKLKQAEELKVAMSLKAVNDLKAWRLSLKNLVKTRKVPCVVKHGDHVYIGKIHWYKEDTDVFEFSDKVNTSFEKLESIFPPGEENVI